MRNLRNLLATVLAAAITIAVLLWFSRAPLAPTPPAAQGEHELP